MRNTYFVVLVLLHYALLLAQTDTELIRVKLATVEEPPFSTCSEFETEGWLICIGLG